MKRFVTEKFREGALLYNPEAKEDGLVSRVYQSNGRTMYEVWVSRNRATWAQGRYISNWVENKLELSGNTELKCSVPPRKLTK